MPQLRPLVRRLSGKSIIESLYVVRLLTRRLFRVDKALGGLNLTSDSPGGGCPRELKDLPKAVVPVDEPLGVVTPKKGESPFYISRLH